MKCNRCIDGYTRPISGGKRRCVKCKGTGILALPHVINPSANDTENQRDKNRENPPSP